MPSLTDFSRRIKVQANRIAEGSDALTRKVALAADQAVVSGTPVDQGRARSNWVVELNAPADGVIDAYVPGEKGSTVAENTQAAIDQGSQVISGYEYGDEIHITNNLPYIQALNDGSSYQAAANFVETAVLDAAEIVAGAKVLDGK